LTKQVKLIYKDSDDHLFITYSFLFNCRKLYFCVCSDVWLMGA